MKSTDLTTYLTSNLDIDATEIASIIEHCQTRKVVKEQYLLRENEHCRHTFFVEKGLLRQFSIDDKGKEHIVSFAPENWFVTDRESSYFKQPSAYFIQACLQKKHKTTLYNLGAIIAVGYSVNSNYCKHG